MKYLSTRRRHPLAGLVVLVLGLVLAGGFYSMVVAPATAQDDELAARFDPVLGGRRLANYLRVLTLETQTLARACGKSHVHNMEPEDLVALTVEASLMTGIPLAGMQRSLVDEVAERVAQAIRPSA